MHRVFLLSAFAALCVALLDTSPLIANAVDGSWYELGDASPSSSTDVVVFAIEGTPPGDFSLRVDGAVAGDIRMEFFLDGALYAVENHAPYSLFGDDGRTLNRGSLLGGRLELTVLVYPQNSSEVLARGSVTLAGNDSPTSTRVPAVPSPVPEVTLGTTGSPPSVTPVPAVPSPVPEVTLATTGSPPSSFTLQAMTSVVRDIRVEFVVNGELAAVENVEPYSLFGDNGRVMNRGSLGAGANTVVANVYAQESSTLLASGELLIGSTMPPATLTSTPTRIPPTIETHAPSYVPQTATAASQPPATQTPTPTPVTPTATLTATGVPPTATRTTAPTAALPPTATPTISLQGGTRDKYLWPFSSTSPWNMPIGSGAQYVPLNLPRTKFYAEGEFVYLAPSAPLRVLRNNGAWPAKCGGGSDQGQVRIPDGVTIPQGGSSYKPNNAAGALRADGHTIQEFLYASRCDATGEVFTGFASCSHDIAGDGGIGKFCGHGGSGLSGVGGDLRAWEVSGTGPITHVLKLTMPSYLLSSCNGGRRWPAVAADTGYNDAGSWQRYAGAICDFRMGSLAAIPPAADCQALVSSDLARRVCHALQDYGAYVVDVHPSWNPGCACARTDWRPLTINVEGGAESTLMAAGSELLTLFQNLSVVTNNAASSVGGGGAPRVPLAPPIGN